MFNIFRGVEFRSSDDVAMLIFRHTIFDLHDGFKYYGVLLFAPSLSAMDAAILKAISESQPVERTVYEMTLKVDSVYRQGRRTGALP